MAVVQKRRVMLRTPRAARGPHHFFAVRIDNREGVQTSWRNEKLARFEQGEFRRQLAAENLDRVGMKHVSTSFIVHKRRHPCALCHRVGHSWPFERTEQGSVGSVLKRLQES